MQHPVACSLAMKPEDSFSIVWDSGASMCISPVKEDFIGEIKTLPKGAHITGIANNLKIEGYGKVVWSVIDSNGALRDLKLPCYFCPKIKQRLLSTSVFMKTYPHNQITMSSHSWKVKGNPNNPKESAFDIFINKINNLPTSTSFRRSGVATVASNFSESISMSHKSNFNLSEPQKELLRWHFRLGHVGLRTVQFLMRTGVLAASASLRRLHSAASKILHHSLPKCPACNFGCQTNRSVPGKATRIIKDREGILSADQLHPGQRVFVDHFVSSTHGRRIKGFGVKSPSGNSSIISSSSTEPYKGGCLFVDASSGFVHVEFQSHLNSDETIQAIANF